MSENQTPSQPQPQSQPPRPQGSQADEVMQQAQQMVTQLGIDINTGILVLILAAVSAIVAALLDEILGLPTGALAFTFAWFVGALNGPTYAVLKNAYNLPGLIMSAVTGLVTLLVWFIVTEIITGDLKYSDSPHYLFRFWFDDLNVLKAMLTGAIVGMLGFGWFVLLQRLPKDLVSRMR